MQGLLGTLFNAAQASKVASCWAKTRQRFGDDVKWGHVCGGIDFSFHLYRKYLFGVQASLVLERGISAIRSCSSRRTCPNKFIFSFHTLPLIVFSSKRSGPIISERPYRVPRVLNVRSQLGNRFQLGFTGQTWSPEFRLDFNVSFIVSTSTHIHVLTRHIYTVEANRVKLLSILQYWFHFSRRFTVQYIMQWVRLCLQEANHLLSNILYLMGRSRADIPASGCQGNPLMYSINHSLIFSQCIHWYSFQWLNLMPLALSGVWFLLCSQSLPVWTLVPVPGGVVCSGVHGVLLFLVPLLFPDSLILCFICSSPGLWGALAVRMSLIWGSLNRGSDGWGQSVLKWNVIEINVSCMYL